MQGLHLHQCGRTTFVPFGQLVCLQGPVGSGKSLLLRRLAGLLPCPSDWYIRFDGDQKTIRLLFDRPRPLWLGETLLDELSFQRPGISPRSAERLLARWRIEGVHLHQPLFQLNRLQSIRFALVLMDWEGVRLALLDNPSDALPERDAAALAEDLSTWCKEQGCIVIAATNRPRDWKPFAHRSWIMEDGRVRDVLWTRR